MKRPAGRGAVRRDRARPEHRAVQRAARDGRERVSDHPRGDPHECRWGVRLRRRPGPQLSSGRHRGRFRLHGGHRRGAVPRAPRALKPLTLKYLSEKTLKYGRQELRSTGDGKRLSTGSRALEYKNEDPRVCAGVSLHEGTSGLTEYFIVLDRVLQELFKGLYFAVP